VYRWWLIRGLAQQDATGTILKWFGTCTDIHDLKSTEEAFIRGKGERPNSGSTRSVTPWFVRMSQEISTSSIPLLKE